MEKPTAQELREIFRDAVIKMVVIHLMQLYQCDYIKEPPEQVLSRVKSDLDVVKGRIEAATQCVMALNKVNGGNQNGSSDGSH